MKVPYLVAAVLQRLVAVTFHCLSILAVVPQPKLVDVNGISAAGLQTTPALTYWQRNKII